MFYIFKHVTVVVQSRAIQPHETDAGGHTEYREDIPTETAAEGGTSQPREEQGQCGTPFVQGKEGCHAAIGDSREV